MKSLTEKKKKPPVTSSLLVVGNYDSLDFTVRGYRGVFKITNFHRYFSEFCLIKPAEKKINNTMATLK
uniref:Uncharacterized protein n=1 Tax=Octopus bimaculoides TaxID=37653 RepID=A0A0L8HLP7_OCTBM